ncbi:hypothetical protein GCM10027444_43040 [Actinopolyspora lacussalsi]
MGIFPSSLAPTSAGGGGFELGAALDDAAGVDAVVSASVPDEALEESPEAQPLAASSPSATVETSSARSRLDTRCLDGKPMPFNSLVSAIDFTL